jgi:hypothetical protein
MPEDPPQGSMQLARPVARKLLPAAPPTVWSAAEAREIMIDPQTTRLRNLRRARSRRIAEFTQLQRTRREWINFVEIREWYRNATGRSAADGEDALRAAVEAGDFEGQAPGQSRIMFLHPYLSLRRMRRRLTRDMLRGAAAADEGGIWNNYLACCWISNADVRAWFERQNLPAPTALGSSTLPVAEPAAEQRAKRGRPAVSGWELADEPLLNEMASFIANGTARSVHHAAGMVVAHAKGSGTPESKQRRLAKAYRAKPRHGE